MVKMVDTYAWLRTMCQNVYLQCLEMIQTCRKILKITSATTWTNVKTLVGQDGRDRISTLCLHLDFYMLTYREELGGGGENLLQMM